MRKGQRELKIWTAQLLWQKQYNIKSIEMNEVTAKNIEEELHTIKILVIIMLTFLSLIFLKNICELIYGFVTLIRKSEKKKHCNSKTHSNAGMVHKPSQ